MGEHNGWAAFTAKLHKLYERVAYMQKGGTNTHFKYKFLQESELKQRLNLACRELGLVLGSVHLSVVPAEQVEGAKPTTRECTVLCSVRLVDAADDSLSVTLQGLGGGTDSSDKAPMKACVAAFKYAIMNGLCVATGDDPEADAESDRSAQAGLLDELERCTSVAALQGLKARVVVYQGCPGFDELKSAYKQAADRLSAKQGA